jgi:hypothetical protein
MNIFQKTKILYTLNRVWNNIPQPMTINGSWRTTVFGAGGLLALAAEVAGKLLDGNPDTNPDWPTVLTMAIPLIGLLFAKDAAVSNSPHPTPKAQTVE